MLQPKYTMNGLGVHDEMRANGSVHSRVLVVQLKSNLTTLQPQLQDAIASSFAQEIANKAMNPEGEIIIRRATIMTLTPVRLHRSPGSHNGKERGC
jgi:hypothetical protein